MNEVSVYSIRWHEVDNFQDMSACRVGSEGYLLTDCNRHTMARPVRHGMGKEKRGGTFEGFHTLKFIAFYVDGVKLRID
jgi:hypothetical protein